VEGPPDSSGFRGLETSASVVLKLGKCMQGPLTAQISDKTSLREPETLKPVFMPLCVASGVCCKKINHELFKKNLNKLRKDANSQNLHLLWDIYDDLPNIQKLISDAPECSKM